MGMGRGGRKGVESQREGGGGIAVGFGIEREEGQEEDVVTCHSVSQCHPQEGTHDSSANRNVIPFLDAKGKKSFSFIDCQKFHIGPHISTIVSSHITLPEQCKHSR